MTLVQIIPHFSACAIIVAYLLEKINNYSFFFLSFTYYTTFYAFSLRRTVKVSIP